MAERFTVESNGVGGALVWDGRKRKVVAEMSFRRDAVKAATRLNHDLTEWAHYYRVEP